MKFQTLLYRPSPKKTSKCTGWLWPVLGSFILLEYESKLTDWSCCSLARAARVPVAFRQTINAPTHLASLSNRGFAKDVRWGYQKTFHMFPVLVLIFSWMLMFLIFLQVRWRCASRDVERSECLGWRCCGEHSFETNYSWTWLVVGALVGSPSRLFSLPSRPLQSSN